MAITKNSRVWKFGTVGLVSLVVGTVSLNAIYYTTHQVVLANTLAYAISVLNGFLLNRQWTFKDKRGESVWAQGGKYFAANFAGYAIHTALLVTSLATYAWLTVPSRYTLPQIAEGVVHHHGGPQFHWLVLNGCSALATGVVTVFNYLVNRSWSFRH